MQGSMAAMAMYSMIFILLSLCKFKELHIGLNVFPARLKVKSATPISNGGLLITPPGYCTGSCPWQV